MIEQPTVMGMKVGWSQKMVDDFKRLLKHRHYTKAKMALEIHRLNNIIEGQSTTLEDRDEEIARLRSIDRAMRDFIFERDKAEREKMAREGFEDVIASRQPRRHI